MTIYDPACRRCPLSARPRREGLHVCIPASGPDDADIIFFGEAPGADEETANAPFVGRAGRELDGLLAKAKLSRKRVRVSNAVRCRPDGNATPGVDAVRACAYYTIRELEMVRPKVIVALGGSALKALTGQEAVGQNRGKLLKLLPDYRSDVRVVPTYHPAAYLHNPANRKPYRTAILEDLRLAKKVARQARLDASVVTPFDGDEAVAGALALLDGAERLSVDLEWESIPSKGDLPKGSWPWSRRNGRRPRRVSVAVGGRVDGGLVSVAVPLRNTPYSPREQRRAVRRLIARKPAFGHWLMTDLIWLYAMGWRVGRVAGCTLTLAGLLNIEGSLALDALAGRLTAMPADWKLSDEAGSVPETEDEWREKLIYNARDTVADVMLLEAEERMAVERGREAVLPLYEQVLLPATDILARAALAGVPIDEELLAETYAEDKATVERLTAKIGRSLGIHGDVETVLHDGAKLGPYLERATGVTLPRQPKKGGTSVTKDVLAQLAGQHPSIALEQKRRKAQTRINNNWRPWSMMLREQGDERLHTIFKLHIARTGRTSADSEAGHTFQQFLRGDKYRRLVKARKGWRIGQVDQSQIELRVIAWLANERRMLDYFQRDDDLHTAMAGLVKAMGDGATFRQYMADQERWTRTVTGDERTSGKVPNFGCGFGGTWRVLQRNARQDFGVRLSQAQCELMHEAYHLFYPDMKPWHESCWALVRQGWVETPTHRIRPLVFSEGEDDEGILRKAINTPVQNFASDLALFCMVYTIELLGKEYGRHLPDIFAYDETIGFFHDAMQFHFDKRERSAIEEIVQTAWEHPPLDRLGIEFPVPLKADIKIGRRWKG